MQTPRSQKVLFGVGAALVLVGAVMGGCWMFIYDYIVKSQLTLTPTSTSYELWEDIPLAIYMEFNMFNVTNAAAVQKNPSVAPEVVEMGPYVWRERHLRVNVTWNKENDTVTYRQIRRWTFEPELSKGNLSDMVTNFNVIATTTAYSARHMPYILRLFISRFIDRTNSTMFVTRNVSQLIFDGYDDKLLDLGNKLNTSLFVIPFTKFGYFVDRNNSYEYDGYFNMYTGADDLYKLALLTRWNFVQHTGFFGYPCDEVKGSSGDLWPPFTDYRDLHIFAPDICLAVALSYEGPTSRRGVPGLGYIGTNKTFDNGELFPEQRCLCTGECVPRGALNVSLCKWGAPIFVTYPHFYLADPYYLTQVNGLSPDPVKHRLDFGINPTSGIPLFVNARMQLNLMIDKYPNIDMFQGFKTRRFVPLFWFNQRTEIDSELAPLARLLLMAPQLGAGIFYGLAAVGILLIVTAMALRYKGAWADDRQPLVDQDEEEEDQAHIRS